MLVSCAHKLAVRGRREGLFQPCGRFRLPHLAPHVPVDGGDAEIVLHTTIRKRSSRKNEASTFTGHTTQGAIGHGSHGPRGPTAATRNRVHINKGDVGSCDTNGAIVTNRSSCRRLRRCMGREKRRSGRRHTGKGQCSDNAASWEGGSAPGARQAAGKRGRESASSFEGG